MTEDNALEGEEFVGPDDLPVLAPVQPVGGNIHIGPNENLDTDEVVVTMELLAMVPSPEGPQLAILPVLMETEVFDMLIHNTTDTRENL